MRGAFVVLFAFFTIFSFSLGFASEGSDTFLNSRQAQALAWDAMDDNISMVKPAGEESRQVALAKCGQLSQLAKERNISTLVIGFEGWLSFSPEATRTLYRYHWNLWSNKKSMGRSVVRRPETTPDSGYVARGTIPPLVEKHWSDIEVLSYSFDHLNTAVQVPLICAQTWMSLSTQANPRSLVLIGHSLGGSAVLKLTRRLQESNIPVSLAVTLDPVCSVVGVCDVEFRKRENVVSLLNYFQNTFVPVPPNYWGSAIHGADRNEKISVNHLAVPFDDKVVRGTLNAVGNIIKHNSRLSGTDHGS